MSSRTGIFDIVLEDRIENMEKWKMAKLSVPFGRWQHLVKNNDDEEFEKE